MNGLKLTNDVFGHKYGDQLLTNMANVLRICSRDDDVLVRWGGDEYLILLPKTDSDQAHKISERIQKVCHEYRWDPIELSVALGTATQYAPDVDFSELFSVAERRMYANKTMESDHVLGRLLSGFEKTLVARCDESREHADAVADLANRLFAKSQSQDGDVETLQIAARFHDIGKVSVDEHLFAGQSPLNSLEWEVMKQHSEAGYRTAKALNRHQLANVILSIHEHWDGNGYPQQLQGELIPLESRTIAIAETYDVLTRGKNYKEGISPTAALKVIEQSSGSQFDPVLVERFVAMVRDDLK
jgi:diguanylate cyclase (GGDEF)-like protein